VTEPQQAEQQTSSHDGSVAHLETSVRKLRWWLGVLTAILALQLVGSVSPLFVILGVSLLSSGGEVTSAELRGVESAIRSAFPRGVDDLAVRAVTVHEGDTPWPLSFIDESSQMIYVTYRPSAAKATIASIFDPSDGDTLAGSGLLPPQADDENRLSPDQFAALLAEYGRTSDQPLGGVVRHEPDSEFLESGSDTTATVGGVGYRASELWVALPGRTVEGDTVQDSRDVVGTRHALVFRLDAATGEFSYVGSEPYSAAFDEVDLDD